MQEDVFLHYGYKPEAFSFSEGLLDAGRAVPVIDRRYPLSGAENRPLVPALRLEPIVGAGLIGSVS